MKTKAVWLIAVLAALFFGSSAQASTLTAWYTSSGTLGSMINVNTGDVLQPINISTPTHTASPGGTSIMDYNPTTGQYSFASNFTITSVPSTPIEPPNSYSGEIYFSTFPSQLTYTFHVSDLGVYTFNQPSVSYSGQGVFTQDNVNPVGYVYIHGAGYLYFQESGNLRWYECEFNAGQGNPSNLEWTPGMPTTNYVDNIIDAGLVSGASNPQAINLGLLSPGDYLFMQGFVLYGEMDSLVNIVPVPGAVWLLGSGLLGLAGWRRFRKS